MGAGGGGPKAIGVLPAALLADSGSEVTGESLGAATSSFLVAPSSSL